MTFMEGTTQIFISNTDTGNASYSPNTNGINLPTNPSVFDLNRIMSQPQDSQAGPQPADSSKIFGTHIKEAVTIVKDWVRDGKK